MLIYLIIFLLSTGYCILESFSTVFFQNFYTVLFVISLCALFVYNVKQISSNEEFGFKKILIQFFIIHFGFGIGGYFTNSNVNFFWVTDSVNTHLPEALKYLKFLKGEISFSQIGEFAGVSTHLVTGIFIGIFGENSFSTVMAQFVFKTISISATYLICLKLWDRRTGLIAILLYGLCPTVMLYNLVLYKESASQAYFSLSLLFLINVFVDKKYWHFVFLLFSVVLLLNERFYLAYLFLLMLPYFIYNLPFKKSFFRVFMFGVLIFLIFYGAYLFNYKQALNNFSLIDKIKGYRAHHQGFSDVKQGLNYSIPYPLAVVKLFFTPYFALNKFNMFFNISTLLTWGSFINQLIVGCSLIGFYKLVREKFLYFVLWLPFIVFITVTAYVSPWNGRLRDSFYCCIVCYASYFLVQNNLFKKWLLTNK